MTAKRVLFGRFVAIARNEGKATPATANKLVDWRGFGLRMPRLAQDVSSELSRLAVMA